MITWLGYYFVIMINPAIGSDGNIHGFPAKQHNKDNNQFIDEILKYTEWKWKEKKYQNSNKQGDFLQRLFAVELTVLNLTSDLEWRRKPPHAAVQTLSKSAEDWEWALHSRVELENCDSHLLMYVMMPNAGRYDMWCATIYRLCAGIDHYWISWLVCPFIYYQVITKMNRWTS